MPEGMGRLNPSSLELLPKYVIPAMEGSASISPRAEAGVVGGGEPGARPHPEAMAVGWRRKITTGQVKKRLISKNIPVTVSSNSKVAALDLLKKRK